MMGDGNFSGYETMRYKIYDR